MGRIDVLATAIASVLDHWPLLLLVPLAQLAHELTHFFVARAAGREAIIQIRLRTPMRVRYDDEGISPRVEALIGLSPLLAGLTLATGWILAVGWPTLTPVSVIGIVAWALYTTPSSEDVSAVPELVGHTESLGEPRRSFFIALTAFAVASWIPALPFQYILLHWLSTGIYLAAIGYMGIAVYEHGLPKPDSTERVA